MPLSGLSARVSGCFLILAIRSARPSIIPDCGPPISLSPDAKTKSAPSFMHSLSNGSCVSPNGLESMSEPDPISSITGKSLVSAALTISVSDASSVKPSMEKLEGWTLIKAFVSGPMASR